jgi:hypothetical protein
MAKRSWFYEESRKRGWKLFSVHKGPIANVSHLANPKDVERRLQNPDLTLDLSSAIQHDRANRGFRPKTPGRAEPHNPTTGDFEWHQSSWTSQRNPQINATEIGSFLALAIASRDGRGMARTSIHGADHHPEY